MEQETDFIITPQELKTCIGRVTLVDVREPEEHAEGHLPQCKLIPLGELASRAEAELKKDDAIVLYCAHGVRSMHALLLLKKLGFKNLKSLKGGIAAWE